MGEIISKNVSSKYNQKCLDLNHAIQTVTDALKTALKKQFKRQYKQLII